MDDDKDNKKPAPLHAAPEPEMDTSNVHGVRFGGEVSPASLLANAMRRASQMEVCMVVSLQKNGEFHVGWTKCNGFKMLGIAHAAIDELKKTLRED